MRAWIAIAAFMLAAGPAHGQDNGAPPAATDPKRAAALFDEGRKLLEQDHVADACSKFDESIRFDPTAAGTMLNLGLCNEKLGKYRTALLWFRKGQTRAAESGLPDAERVAKDHTAELALKVATVHIAFAAPVADGTRVKIDGDEVKPEDYARVEVDPGHHKLSALAPGMLIVRQEFDVAGQGGETYTIAFVPGSNSTVIDRGRSRRRLALYAAVGTVIVGGADAAVLAIAQHNYCLAVVDCHGGLQSLNPKEPNAMSKANAAQWQMLWIGTPLFVVAATGAAATAFLYFTAAKPERINETVFAPTLGPNDVGFALSGKF